MSAAHSDDAWVAFGRIGRARGLRGDVFVDLYNPDSDLIETLAEVGVGSGGAAIRPARLSAAQRSSSRWVLAFEGVDDRTAAEALTNQTLFIRRADLPALPAGQFYHFELIGFAVRDLAGAALGTLASIVPTASNEIYSVRTPEGGELDLPNIPGVIRAIDPAARVITVDPPEVDDAV